MARSSIRPTSTRLRRLRPKRSAESSHEHAATRLTGVSRSRSKGGFRANVADPEPAWARRRCARRRPAHSGSGEFRDGGGGHPRLPGNLLNACSNVGRISSTISRKSIRIGCISQNSGLRLAGPGAPRGVSALLRPSLGASAPFIARRHRLGSFDAADAKPVWQGSREYDHSRPWRHADSLA
jgi:hypothetical protein